MKKRNVLILMIVYFFMGGEFLIAQDQQLLINTDSTDQITDTLEKKSKIRKKKGYKSERIKGMWAVDLSSGRHKRKTAEGDDHGAFYIEAGLLKLLKRNIGLRGGLNYEKGDIGFASYNRILLVPELIYNIYNLGGFLYFNVSAGLPAGYEQVSNAEIPEKFSYLVYGGSLGFISELNLSNRILLTISFRENILYGSKLGRFDYQFHGGLRWYF